MSMMIQFAALSPGSSLWLPSASLVLVCFLGFLRIVSYLSIVPFMGGELLPARLRVGASLCFVIIIVPLLQSQLESAIAPVTASLFMAAAMGLKEVCVGATLGFVSSLVFEAVEVAGRVIDFQRGMMIAETYAPHSGAQVSLLGQFKLQFAMMVFLGMGAHRHFIAALSRSFEIIPVLSFPKLAAGWTSLLAAIVTLSSQVLVVGLQLAAPVIVTLVLLDLLSGVVNRAAPHVNVFFLSLPLKGLCAVAVVLMILPITRDRFAFYFMEVLKDLEGLIRIVVT